MPRVNHRSGAHRARLQRDVKRAAVEPVVAECGRGLAHRDDLGVRRGIAGADAREFCPRAMIAPSCTTTAPIGTSPASAALRASASALRMASRSEIIGAMVSRTDCGYVRRDCGVCDVYACAAGCCWVMQCSVPRPQTRSTAVDADDLAIRKQPRRECPSAMRSFGSWKVGTSTSPLAM